MSLIATLTGAKQVVGAGRRRHDTDDGSDGNDGPRRQSSFDGLPWKDDAKGSTLASLLAVADWKSEEWADEMQEKIDELKKEAGEKNLDPETVVWVSWDDPPPERCPDNVKALLRLLSGEGLSTIDEVKDAIEDGDTANVFQSLFVKASKRKYGSKEEHQRALAVKDRDKNRERRELPLKTAAGRYLTFDEIVLLNDLWVYEDELENTDNFGTMNPPWEGLQEMKVVGWGGVASHDDRRITIAGSYQSFVEGDRDVDIAGDMELEVDGNHAVQLTDADSTDSLEVHGDAHVHFKERTYLGSGRIDRVWFGAIKRMIPMEGIICGGALSKSYLGASTTVSAVCSGDVYGAAGRTAGVRIYIAGFNYRSAEFSTHWQMGSYFRQTTNTIEPLVGSPAKYSPQGNAAKKAFNLATMLCPLLDIFMGVAGALLFLPMLVLGLAKAKLLKKKPPPPPGPPRLRNRTVGLTICTRATDTTS